MGVYVPAAASRFGIVSFDYFHTVMMVVAALEARWLKSFAATLDDLRMEQRYAIVEVVRDRLESSASSWLKEKQKSGQAIQLEHNLNDLQNNI